MRAGAAASGGPSESRVSHSSRSSPCGPPMMKQRSRPSCRRSSSHSLSSTESNSRPPARQQHEMRALGDPLRHAFVLAHLDQLQAGVAGEQSCGNAPRRPGRAAAGAPPRSPRSAWAGCDTTRVPEDGERHFNIHTDPDTMAGHYANFANVSHSDYEFTLTFARVDHEVEEGEVPGRRGLADQPVAALHARADRRHGGQLLQVAHPRGDPRPARARRAGRHRLGAHVAQADLDGARRCCPSRGCRGRPRASGTPRGNFVSSTPPSVQLGIAGPQGDQRVGGGDGAEAAG